MTKSPFVTVNYDKLNEVIKKRGTSRAKCALACGINPGVLGASFKRSSRIRAEYLVKIADFLCVSPVLFLKGEDEKITNDNHDGGETMSDKKPEQPIIPLTYGKNAASAAFGVSVPVIDSWIKRQDDPLPSFREGARVLIPVKEAQEWVSRQAKKAMEDTDGNTRESGFCEKGEGHHCSVSSQR